MAVKHKSYLIPAFPVYSAGFVSDNELVLGGGGGSSRAGIKNKLKLYQLDEYASRYESVKLKLLDELELEQDADAPMSMAVDLGSKQVVCGINSAMALMEKGQNENCRLFNASDNTLVSVSTRGTLTGGDIEDYQRVTVISRDGQLVVAAGAHDFCLLKFPSLELVVPSIHVEKGEVYDATFSSQTLVIVTTLNLLIYALQSDGNEGLRLLKIVDHPSIPGAEAGSAFRSARFHPKDDNIIYTVFNTTSKPEARTRSKSKMTPRQAYVCKWDVNTWENPKFRKISDRGLTCFDISPNGRYLAFGSSDYTVGILDTITLAPLLSISKAHGFPPTTLRFNPSSTLLVSGSPDNTIRVFKIPAERLYRKQSVSSTTLLLTLSLVLVILALLLSFSNS